ncbi:MAG: hypothetical protein HY820_20170 [Acidobacteria bacterium]|nr:hypothetical protein [Acidobacteriota bacterium]
MKRLILLSAAALAAIASGTKPDAPVCGPAYEKILDFRGNPLPRETPYIASVELNSKTAMVFRKEHDDIHALVTRLKAEGGHEPQMLTAAFWQGVRCRKVNDRCEGECPKQGDRQLRCVLERHDPPNPPPAKKKKGPTTPPSPPHGKDSGKPKEIAQSTTVIRCLCK